MTSFLHFGQGGLAIVSFRQDGGVLSFLTSRASNPPGGTNDTEEKHTRNESKIDALTRATSADRREN
jgi:hypothetical protein